MYRKLLAKSSPAKPLLAHMLETGAVTMALMEDSAFQPVCAMLAAWLNVPEERAARFLGFMSALHDVGKCHPCMQVKLGLDESVLKALYKAAPYDDYVQGAFRHEQYSRAIAETLLREELAFSHKQAVRMAQVLSLHHQKNTSACIPLEGRVRAQWEAMQRRLFETLCAVFDPPRGVELGAHVDAACMLVLGVVILSDWMASGRLFEAQTLDEGEDAAAYAARSAERARAFIRESDMARCKLPACGSFCQTWPTIPREGMRPLQAAVEACLRDAPERPLAVLLEAPMGEGKTEAGMYAALRLAQMWNKSGFYIALPTAATSNQMLGRINALLALHDGASGARLLHANAFLLDDATEDGAICTQDEREARDWTKPLRRGLLSACAVGTVDQAMQAAMAVRFGALRMLGLSGKVLVIDEIHSYDCYMSTILERLLAWCRALCVPVVLMSATLPAEKKERFMRIYRSDARAETVYPAITLMGERTQVVPVGRTYQTGCVRTRTLPMLGDEAQIAEYALSSVRDGGCLCVLMNTVREAQAVYGRICGRADCTTLLFHAGFTAELRAQKEAACIRLFGKDKSHRPQRAILVASQVVEQSLDIDLDRMITAVAPVDLLLQRMGRMHRHRDTVRPKAFEAPQLDVLVPGEEAGGDPEWRYGASGCVYAPYLLRRTEKLLKRIGQIRIPEDIAPLVEQVYGGMPDADDEMEIAAKYDFAQQMEGGEAQMKALSPPSEKRFQLINESVFYDDREDAPFLAAKTRLGEEGVRLAFLPEALFDEAAGRKANLQTAQAVMRHSVSVRKSRVAPLLDRIADKAEGDGLLRGVTLLCCRDNRCSTQDGTTLVMDGEYGLMIQGRDGDAI